MLYVGDERTIQLVDDGATLVRRRGLSANLESGFEAFRTSPAAKSRENSLNACPASSKYTGLKELFHRAFRTTSW